MRTYIGYTGTDDVSSGFTNYDIIEAAPGAALTLNIPMSGNSQTITNNGIMEADRGATLTLHGERSYTYNFATVDNNGLLTTNGGTIHVQANLHQSAGAKISADHGGTILLEGATDGGTIQITNANLNFGNNSRAGPGGPGGAIAGGETASPVVLAGRMDIMEFGHSGLTIAFNAKTNELNVTGLWSGKTYTVADLHLSGHYSAQDFTVAGASVVYRV